MRYSNHMKKSYMPRTISWSALVAVCFYSFLLLPLAVAGGSFGSVVAQESGRENVPDEEKVETQGSNDAGETDPNSQEPEAAAPTVSEIIDESAPNDLVRPGDEARKKIDALKLELDHIQLSLQRDDLSDAELKDLRDSLRPLDEEIVKIDAFLAPLVKEIDKRVAELGPAPQGDAPQETESVKAERELHAALQSEVYGAKKEIKLISLRASQLTRAISERRRILFSNRIFERRREIFDPSLWGDFGSAVPIALIRLRLLANDTFVSLQKQMSVPALLLLGLIFIAGLFFIPVARRISRWIAQEDVAGYPASKLRKIANAAWTSFAIFFIPNFVAISAYTFLISFGTFNGRVETLIRALVGVIFLMAAVFGVCYAILAPARPKWRLINLPDHTARSAMILIISATAIFVTDFFLTEINSILYTPLPLTLGESVIADMLVALLLAVALKTINKGILENQEPASEESPSPGLFKWRWVQLVFWLAIITIPIAQIFGYLSFSQFISTQLVVTGIIIAALVLAMMVVDEALTRGIGAGGEESLAEQIGKTLGVQRNKIELLSIVLNGLFKITLLIIALSFLLVPWGFETKDIFSWIRSAFFGISIGGLTISMATIFTSIGIFILISIATRAVQRWLETRFLPHTDLDIGIRTSIKTACGYAGILLAFALSLTYLGFDMSSLAIVAGALSLGIGFGLQSVVNNFVSGLILLVERPIKTGDWIVVGQDEGYVRKISVRSTEIETFDSAAVIVPNSDLISGVVTNWMHKDLKGRVKIPIGVGYDSDPTKVQDILMDIAVTHPDVLKYPQPRVYFLNFGDSSLDFELRVHLRNIDDGMSIKSQLRTSMLHALRDADIEIPFPQRNINMGDMTSFEKALAGKAGNSPKPSNKKPRARTRAAKSKP